MKRIDHAIVEFKEMDEMAKRDSLVHSVNPVVKLIITIAYIFVTVSFGKYDLSGLIIMCLYPIALFEISDTSIGACFYKLRIVIPLVCAVGIFNPFLDKETLLYVGNVAVSGGVVSMFTLMLKGVFCIMASFVLVATTSFDEICAALRRLHIPGFFVTLLLLTYRYISVMMEEVSVMTDAYMLRAPGQKGVHFSAWGSFLGQLLLRSMDRAEELYSSMRLRGFNGEFIYASLDPLKGRDYAFLFASLGIIALFRFTELTAIIGQLVM